MIGRLLFSATLISTVAAQSNSTREVVYTTLDACPHGGCPSPLFDKGYLIQLKDYRGGYPSDGYDLWAPDGTLLHHVDILAPDGTAGHVQDVAIDTDGVAIVPISYGGWGGPGHVKGGGLVVVDPAGKQVRFISTDRWLPAHACFGPDHSIWASGTQYEPLRDGDDFDHHSRGDYLIVRKYSLNGQLLGAFLPRSSFPPGLPPADYGKLRAASDRIGVLTHPGKVGKYPEWVELGLDGNLIGRWKLGPDSVSDPDTHRATYQLNELAFTADGRLFALPSDYVSHKRQIMIFDRATSSWKPSDAVGIPPVQSELVGADGDNLAFERRNGSVEVIWKPLTPRERSVE
ncbi:MAG TPA: hypothetical protein VMH05_08060 [Bryobacteraceae bacterium]|nr:hypothetical protein [Bryobacteraceae bacterium]